MENAVGWGPYRTFYSRTVSHRSLGPSRNGAPTTNLLAPRFNVGCGAWIGSPQAGPAPGTPEDVPLRPKERMPLKGAEDGPKAPESELG